MSSQAIRDFIMQDCPDFAAGGTAISLFSGGGLSDLGYRMAGFEFLVQVEVDQRRASIGEDNFPLSKWIVGDVRECRATISGSFRAASSGRLDLLTATPPCQGMSSSNPSRGKRQTPRAKAQENKNRLLLEVIPIAKTLCPRIIVVENVRQVLTLSVEYKGTNGRVIDHLRKGLHEYVIFTGVINVADYGIPQVRKRALMVAVHKDEPWLDAMISSEHRPWPQPTHTEQSKGALLPWVTVEQWLRAMDYEPLDARSKDASHGEHSLHFVPAYGLNRYRQISEIPPYSGRSAYENDTCPTCGFRPVTGSVVSCPNCGSVMHNRPYVLRDGIPSLIKGFRSSYRRINPQRPAYTITTNSSHVGSDFKIHPWENRVFSILECADLQTVPRFYDWTRAQRNKTPYLIRNLVGEAFPTYFAFLHGQMLREMLSGNTLAAGTS